MTDTLPCGVMVARRILVPPVRVRILPRQLKERAKSRRLSSFFIFTPRTNVKNCIFDTYLILFQNFHLHHTPPKVSTQWHANNLIVSFVKVFEC